MWKLDAASVALSKSLGLGSPVDKKFFFNRCRARPDYFAAHAHDITITCTKPGNIISTIAHVVEALWQGGELRLTALALDTSAATAGKVCRFLQDDNFSSKLLAEMAYASGVEGYTEALLLDWNLNPVTPLHSLCQWRKLHPKHEMAVPTFTSIRRRYEKDSQVARAADRDGRQATWFWIRTAFRNPQLKPSFERLIRHFDIDVSETARIDTSGTTLRGHIAETAREAAVELAEAFKDDDCFNVTLYQEALSLKTGPVTRERILDVYRAVVAAIYKSELCRVSGLRSGLTEASLQRQGTSLFIRS